MLLDAGPLGNSSPLFCDLYEKKIVVSIICGTGDIFIFCGVAAFKLTQGRVREQRCAINIATYRWPSISRVLRHIVVYLMYIEEHCLKFIDGVVLIACFLAGLSLILYCK